MQSRQPQRESGWRWQHVTLLGLVVLTGLGATSLCARALDGSMAAPSVLGLRLGETPDMLRARFPDASFRTELGEDVALVAEGALQPEVAPGARFEFHDGQLVAVRIVLSSHHPDSRGDRLHTTAGVVLARSTSDGSVLATLLSRGCPTHRDEAERLASGGALFSTPPGETEALP